MSGKMSINKYPIWRFDSTEPTNKKPISDSHSVDTSQQWQIFKDNLEMEVNEQVSNETH